MSGRSLPLKTGLSPSRRRKDVRGVGDQIAVLVQYLRGLAKDDDVAHLRGEGGQVGELGAVGEIGVGVMAGGKFILRKPREQQFGIDAGFERIGNHRAIGLGIGQLLGLGDGR